MADKKQPAPVQEASAEEMALLTKVVDKVKAAQRLYATYTQEQVDKIFRAAAIAAAQNRIPLAKMAVEESGMGVMEDKVIKNQFASEYIYNKYKDTKTCGVLSDDDAFGYRKVAEPIGVIAGVVPTTNPTATAIFKSLLALKTRNGIVFSPHPRAKKCTIAAAKIVLDAAVAAGAPEGIIGWIENPTMPLSNALMHHPHINLILATGGPGMVKAAYSSGKPALGVGAGNTPAVIDATADIKMAVSSIIMSKTFDNGMICASEQSVIVEEPVYEKVKAEFIARGCHFVTGKDRKKLAETIVVNGKLNSGIVGQSACKIAEMAGIKVPAGTKILIAEASEVNDEEVFAREKLSPVLAFYRAKDFNQAVELARSLILYGGAGHTSVLYTDESNEEHIDIFKDMPTARTLINIPSSQGAIGDVYNFKLAPSLTLGCGSWGGNSVSENIGVKHLMNVKSVAERRENMYWYKVPQKIYFKRGALSQALAELSGKQRAYIITDKTMEQLGHVRSVADVLEGLNIKFRVFSNVLPDPNISNVQEALAIANSWQPDIIIGLGGGSAMDEAKMVWLLYENPDTSFEDIAMRFMDIRKRIYAAPPLGKKATMVAIPTTSGTGSEVTPFTIITDEKTGTKYAITDYALTPDMAIIDPEFVLGMPKKLTAWSGLDVLTHAIEAYTSVYSTNFTEGQALEAARLVFKYLEKSYSLGAKDINAREKMHYAATIAGMAFANAFLGLCHSMAHKLGAMYHVPHGLANALLLTYVIEFNATDKPTKQGLFPQYKYPFVKGRYAKIVDFLLPHNNLGDDKDAKVEKLIEMITDLKNRLDIPKSLKEYGIPEKEFLDNLDKLSELAFDDQCTGGNARYPLISEIKDLYLKAYYGEPVKHKAD
ncbi:MAG: bifunctional acetaldehyde-CoA/alcohol dehydrogenase [Elusimicrobiaceae bacterium]|uniref:bifunctional acetaldehyde-CoA/alcohol dehydrogenase n=1 Tax=Candidatus Avelusimicrobium faecicola TaxID=3416205 RepID=UPI002A7AC5ED|nr:bifunctional acetaldehyde-CoA/alcohol dehydrogenase [Elusimicrobiaceae bacterium]